MEKTRAEMQELVDALGLEDLFGTRGYWEQAMGGRLIPGTKPWFEDIVGAEFYHVSSVCWYGGPSPECRKRIKGSAALKRHLEDWAKQGRMTILAGWGHADQLVAHGLTQKIGDALADTIVGCDGTVFRRVIGQALEELEQHFFEDPSAKRDRLHKPVGLPERTPFNHFPELKGWILETSTDGEEVGSSGVL